MINNKEQKFPNILNKNNSFVFHKELGKSFKCNYYGICSACQQPLLSEIEFV